MRLVNLPDSNNLVVNLYKCDVNCSFLRLGQFVWNNWGQVGVDGKGWPELFYEEDEGKVLQMLDKYREEM